MKEGTLTKLLYTGALAASMAMSFFIVPSAVNVASVRLFPVTEQRDALGRLESFCARTSIGFSPYGRNTLCIDTRGNRTLTLDRGSWEFSSITLYADKRGILSESLFEYNVGPADLTSESPTDIYNQAAESLEAMLEERKKELNAPEVPDTPLPPVPNPPRLPLRNPEYRL